MTIQTITIQNIPNQKVTCTVSGFRYEITLKDASGFMVYGVARDGTELLAVGHRVVNRSPLLPYRYLEEGNFILSISDESGEADYTQFGQTQFLYYVPKESLEVFR